jgi:MFS family permease
LGIIAAASPLAGIVFSFPIGFLADRIGKRKLLIWSALIFVLAPLLYLIVTNPLWLIPIRFFHGLATAIMGPIATAMIVTFFEKNKAEKLGVYSSATLFGRTLAPLFGGFLISYFGFLGGLNNYRLVYLVAFILSLPIIFLVWGIPKEDKTVKIKQVKLGEMVMAFRKFVSNKILLSTSIVDMATYFVYGVLEAYLPVFLIGKQIPADLIGLLFSVQVISIALTKPIFGRLADRINKKVQIMLGILILVITTFLIYHINSYPLMLINVLFFGLGMSLSTVATATYISDNVAKENQGTSMGLLSGLMDVGQTFGPFLTGFIVTLFSYQIGFYFSSLIAIIAALFFFWANFSPNEKNHKKVYSEIYHNGTK